LRYWLYRKLRGGSRGRQVIPGRIMVKLSGRSRSLIDKFAAEKYGARRRAIGHLRGGRYYLMLVVLTPMYLSYGDARASVYRDWVEGWITTDEYRDAELALGRNLDEVLHEIADELERVVGG